jgi:hypothetical protein
VPSHFFCELSGPNNKSDGTEAVPPMKRHATSVHGETTTSTSHHEDDPLAIADFGVSSVERSAAL